MDVCHTAGAGTVCVDDGWLLVHSGIQITNASRTRNALAVDGGN